MKEFFTYDPQTIGSKGLVYVGDKILVYRRDDKTDNYPLCLDLPGGAPEGSETPFDTYKREVFEEFGLDIQASDVTYVRRYPSSVRPDKAAYFPVVKLPLENEAKIKFGDEGLEYFLLSTEDYLARENVAWPMLQKRVSDYLESLK